jgi:hypothetical protein
MLQSCIYKCNPDLALSWPDILGAARLTVIELIHGVQSNNVESFAGIIVDAAAKIKVSVGAGGPARFGPYPKEVCYLLLMFRRPLFFGDTGKNLALALQVERLLLQAGAELFAPTLQLGTFNRMSPREE